MKRFFIIIILFFACYIANTFAQNNDLLLARQYAQNGDTSKKRLIFTLNYISRITKPTTSNTLTPC
jgi:hypothetical protein